MVETNDVQAPEDVRVTMTETVEHIDLETDSIYPDDSNGIVEELKAAAEQIIDEQKVKAADAARGIAHAIREAAQPLCDSPAAPIGHYAVQTAANVERLSDRVREEPLGDLLADAEAAARRQPELFFLGAAAAGFLIARFLKSSADRRRAATAAYQASTFQSS